MRSNRKGFLSSETFGTLFGAMVFIVIIIFIANIFSPSLDKEKETGEAYIGSLGAELENVDSDDSGSFEMIDFQGEDDDKIIDSYLIYFGGQLGIYVEDHTFLAPSTDKNLLCVCVWSQAAPSCEIDQCIDLKYPAVIGDSNGDKWVAHEGERLSIKLEGGKYVFEKV